MKDSINNLNIWEPAPPRMSRSVLNNALSFKEFLNIFQEILKFYEAT